MIFEPTSAQNIRILSQEPHNAVIDADLRDTEGNWFYWCFKVRFEEPGSYTFQFATPSRIGSAGPAYSLDEGQTWNWLSDTLQTDVPQPETFTYNAPEPQSVIFCQGMQYLQRDWERFTAECAAKKLPLKTGILCKSRKNRNVELAEIARPGTQYTILLTSRHHAGEMMATHALEGVLRFALSDTALGCEFREKIRLIAVPFVDKDGVEDGDQGKNRRPHDHARDYQRSNTTLYPETNALMDLIDRERPQVILDLHCPWLRGGPTNEMTYMVGTGNPANDTAMKRLGAILEQLAPANAPFCNADNVEFGTYWNTGNNYKSGSTIKHYAIRCGFVDCAQTIEIPFANFRTHRIDHEKMLAYGKAIGEALLEYVDGIA